ncbi:MAG TPA: hypothetical protein VKU19_00960 [Bryobacteraceae bacterium]|nr:hypothetical protein [Bryobacteraceae bacterium]
METVAQIGAKVSEVRESAENLARAASRKIDDVRSGTADALHSAASSIRSTGRQSAAAINDFTSGAADKLHAAGCFVEKNRWKNMSENLRRTVRHNPAGSVIVATALGFLLATAFRAVTHSCESE